MQRSIIVILTKNTFSGKKYGGGAEGSIDTSPKMLMKTGELDECNDRGGLVGRSQGAVALPVGSVLRGTILNDVTFY